MVRLLSCVFRVKLGARSPMAGPSKNDPSSPWSRPGNSTAGDGPASFGAALGFWGSREQGVAQVFRREVVLALARTLEDPLPFLARNAAVTARVDAVEPPADHAGHAHVRRVLRPVEVLARDDAVAVAVE